MYGVAEKKNSTSTIFKDRYRDLGYPIYVEGTQGIFLEAARTVTTVSYYSSQSWQEDLFTHLIFEAAVLLAVPRIQPRH